MEHLEDLVSGQNGFGLTRELELNPEEIFIPSNLNIHANKRKLINESLQRSESEAYKYLRNFIDLQNPKCHLISGSPGIDMMTSGKFNYIVNLHKINDLAYINKFFEEVNVKLPVGGLFAGCVETYMDRERRLFGKFPKFLFNFLCLLDFILNRILPKLYITRKIYYFITKGRNRAISKAEAFGRLVSCGFDIVDYKLVNGLKYFIAKKVKMPSFDMNPSYGPLFRMRRIGKNGKIIHVYKLRTMHPYSEYLQEFIYRNNQLDEGGKFRDDFRISNLGSFMRRFWIDELPMLINIVKGEMKIVGVRPLSEQYFSLYSKELQEKMIKIKPGLIPNFYKDMPKNLDEIMASEMKYLEQYEKNPYWTDFKYFFMSLYNIVLKSARSK